MSYTITIDFPTLDVNPGFGTDTIQLELKFTVDSVGANQSFQSSDKDLIVKNYGNLSLDYQIDDPLLVPSDMNFEINDNADYLAGLMFGSSTEQAATS